MGSPPAVVAGPGEDSEPKPCSATWGELRRLPVDAIEDAPLPVKVAGDYMHECYRVERISPSELLAVA